ncbi:MAG: hypothetical protein L0Y38_01100 [Methylococcaceae bacterium]|nr:hypothetical protein [Methylococcaceae bacterium]
MRIILNAVVFTNLMIFLMVALVGCSKNFNDAEPLPSSVQIGATYYTQVGMFYEKGRYRTTNYGVGIFIPVNTAVELIEFGTENLFVTVESTGETVEVENVPKFTGWSMPEAFETLFAREQVSLFKFNANERQNIESGSIAPGMSKSAVIVARGYPPSHETPSLKRDQWKYWKNRWDTIIVTFKDDKVVEIKD